MAVASVDAKNGYLEALLRGRVVLPAAPSDWLRDLRARGVERANVLTVPTVRDEEWRFTDLAPLYKLPVHPVQSTIPVDATLIAPYAVPEASARLVFVDGHFVASLSALEGEPGLAMANLADGASPLHAVAQKHLGRLARFEADAFAAVNTSFLNDGAVVHIARDTKIEAPIHVLHLSTRKEGAAYPRILVVAESGSECTVIEEYAGAAEAAALTDSVTEVFVGANANVRHLKVQAESPTSFHIANTAVSVERDGRYASWTISTGARISRQNLNIAQAGEGTDFLVDGLSLIGSRQLADTHSSIDHAHPNGRSRQLHKTVVADGAHAVFNGKILVREGAQQTDSGQQSRNLLLSDKAQVDTKPQLEIFADDVKCAHGATVGQLEAEELFYLKSRGLSEATARKMLTYAFAAEIIERIPVKSVADRLGKAVLEQTQRQA